MFEQFYSVLPIYYLQAVKQIQLQIKNHSNSRAHTQASKQAGRQASTNSQYKGRGKAILICRLEVNVQRIRY